MASLNKVILIGNLGKDPETRYAPSGDAICNLTLATTETWKDKATGERKDISRSLPLGSGRLTDRLVTSNPPSMAELHACRDAATSILTPTGVGNHQGGKLYVTGGTGEYMSRLIGKQAGIEPSEVKGLLRRLSTMSAEEVAESSDIPVARAKVLPAGIAIVAALCDLTKPVEIIGAPGGVRTGLLLAAARGSLT